MDKNKKKEVFRALKFLAFSVSAGAIQMISFTILDLIFPATIYYVMKAYIALTLSVLWNFTFNRNFTFKSASNVKIAMLKTLGYYVVFAPLSIHLADIYLVQTLGWNQTLILAITMVVNFATEFPFQRLFVFGKSLDTLEKKNKNDSNKKDEVNPN